MSYVGHKSLAFRDDGDVPLVVRKRSEGRMKTYPSETDARAWGDNTEDRRQHILDLIRANQECALGRYVPIEVLIDTLLTNKNADVGKLRQQIAELQQLLDMYSKLNLTEDQKRMLEGMKRDMAKTGVGLGGLSGQGIGGGIGVGSDEGAIRAGGIGGGGIGGGKGAGVGAGTGGAGGARGIGVEGGIEGGSIGAGKGIGAGAGAGGSSGAGGIGVEGEKGGVGGGGIGGIGAEKGTGAGAGARGSGGAGGIGEEEDKGVTSKASLEDGTGKTVCAAKARPTCAATKGKEEGAGAGAGISAIDTAAARQALDKYSVNDLKDLVIQKDAELIALKNELAAKQAEFDQQNKIARKAIEQLENLKDIMEERDTLRQKLKVSVHELQTLRSRVEDPCVAEIAKLEGEIERLRVKGQLSPEEEAEVIRKEVDVLKKYCAKLSKIQEENGRLKSQVDRLQELSGFPANYQDVVEDSNDPAELKNRLKDLRRKLAKLNEIMDERDKLKQRVKQLEGELLKYGNLPEEIEIFKRRSQLLDDVLDERNSLQERLDQVKGLEEELIELKKRAARANELEGIKQTAAAEFGSLKAQKDESSKTAEYVKADYDELRMKAAKAEQLEDELERLRSRAKEAEVLRIERDGLKIRLDKLAATEVEFLQLLDKTKCLETIKSERDMYKAKYEELLGLECECDMLRAQVERYKQLDKEREALLRQVRDCECCIADQEDEIKKLVGHIDRLSQGSNQQQDRMQKALTDMRAELEQKTSVIAISEEKLAGVQDHLKSTIAEVTCETTCLRAHIDELDYQLHLQSKKLKEKEEEIARFRTQINEKDGLIVSLSEDLQDGKEENERLRDQSLEGDEHFEKMLKQSKTAVQKVAEELEKHYQEWDCMKGRLLDDETQPELSDDVEELKRRIRQLEEELDAANKTIAKLRGDLSAGDRLSAENQALRRHSTEVQDVAKEQIEELIEHLKRAKERIAELEAQNAALMRDAGIEIPPPADDSELRKRLEELERENGKLNKLVEQLQPDAAQGGPDISALLMQLANLEDQLQKESNLRQEAEGRVTTLNNELDFLQSSRTENEMEAELMRLRAENQRLNELEAELNRLKTDNQRPNEFEAELNRLRAENQRLNELEAELNTLKADNQSPNEYEEELNKLRAENQRQSELIAELNKQKADNQKPNEFEAELNKLRAENQRQNELEAELNKLKADNQSQNELEAELSRLRAENQRQGELEAELNRLKAENQKQNEFEDELNRLRAENQRQSELVAELKAENQRPNELEAEVSRLRAENQRQSELEAELNRLKAENQRQGELEAELNRLRSENQQLKENIKSIGDTAVHRTSQAEGEAAVLSEQNKELLNRKQALESENASLSQQIAALKQQLESMKGAAGPATVCEEELEKERKEKEDLQNLIKSLQSQISSTEKAPPPSLPPPSPPQSQPPPSDSSALKDALAKLTAQLEAEQARAAAAESALKRAQSEKPVTADAGTGISDLQKEIATLKARIKELEALNEQLIKAAPGDNSALLSQINDLQQKIKALESGKAELEKQNAQLKTSATSTLPLAPPPPPPQTSATSTLPLAPPPPSPPPKQDVSVSAAEMKDCKDELEKLKTNLKNLEKQNTQLQKAAAGDNSALFDQINDLKKNIKDLEAENAELKETIANLKRLSKDMEADFAADLKRLPESYEEELKKSDQPLIEDAMNLTAEDAAVMQKVKGAYEDRIAALRAELQRQKKECADTVASLKAQYDRDIKNLHNKYNDGIAKLQGSHEEILKDVEKEHGTEVESLRSELRSSKAALDVLGKHTKSVVSEGTGAKRSLLSIKTIENVNIKPISAEKSGVCTCGPDFQRILHKILKEGIENLNFEELRFLHNKTCQATAKVLGKSKTTASSGIATPCVPCSHEVTVPKDTSIQRSDKMFLLRRISSLENDLTRKQRHAQQKVGALQIAIKMERQRLEDLKGLLETERQRNCELMCKIGAQSRAVASMEAERDLMRKKSNFHEDKLQELLLSCEEKKARVRRLEDELNKARHKQRKDTEALENIKMKLENSINSEMMLMSQLGQQPTTTGRSTKPTTCTCMPAQVLVAHPQDEPVVERSVENQTVSFYTELTVQEVKRKREFIHKCCMKHHAERGKRSCSGQRCSQRKSHMDDVD